MSNVITNYAYDISKIDFTNGFINSGLLNNYGERLFQRYKNIETPVAISTSGNTFDGVTFKASASNTFYIGSYRSTLSSWNEQGRVETFFAVFYMHPRGSISGTPYVDISFPKGYVGSTAGTNGTLTIRRTIESGSFWNHSGSSSLFYDKLIPIIAYHSINRRCHSYAGDSAISNLGWCYTYYVGGTNNIQTTYVPSNIITGTTADISDAVFGAKIKTTFSATNTVAGDSIPIFVLDMNNGQRDNASSGDYTDASFGKDKYAEGCIVPTSVPMPFPFGTEGQKFYTGNRLSESLADSGPPYNNKMAYVQSYNTTSGIQFCGHPAIRDDANHPGWTDDDYSLGCGIAFFMSATDTNPANRSFYTNGSWGVSQLIPSLSTKERAIEFYGQADSDKVSGKVYVGDPYGNNSYGWPIEGDDEPSWIRRTGYKLVGWYTSREYTTKRSPNEKVPDGTTTIKLYAKWDPIIYNVAYRNTQGSTSIARLPYGTTVTINNSGGSGDSSFTVTGDKIVTNPTRTGYTFSGYIYDENTNTLTATWEVIAYQLTTQVASTSAGMGTVSPGGNKNYNSSVTITATPNAGYKFVKWVFTGTKSGESTSATTTFTMPAGAVTATAHFEPNKYQLIFNLNSANCPPGLSNPENKEVTFNGKYPAAPYDASWNTAHDTGEWDYEFVEWRLGSSSTTYVPDQTYTTVGNQTWNAHWTKTKKKYTISWYDSDGRGNKTDLLETDSTEYGVTPTYDGPILSKAGYNWSGKTSGWTPSISSVTGTAEYVAVYTPITYTITYKLKNGVNHSDNPATYTIQSPTITFKTPTKTGFTFVRWTSDESGNTPITNIPSGSIGNITIYAWWKVQLSHFDPAPGKDGPGNDNFGIPIDDLDSTLKYRLVLSVAGDRSKYGKSPFVLGANQGSWQNSGNFGWVNDTGEITLTQLQNLVKKNVVIFPMDVWRCRIFNSSAVLKVTLYVIDNNHSESSSTSNHFAIGDENKPQLTSVDYDEGVTNIYNLSLSGSDGRFIGNKKSCVLCNVHSSNFDKNNNEMLYEAVPAQFRVKLDRGPKNSSRTDADWSSGDVVLTLTESQVSELINRYDGPGKEKEEYESGWLEVTDGPFPDIQTDLNNARLRIKIVDTRRKS